MRLNIFQLNCDNETGVLRQIFIESEKINLVFRLKLFDTKIILNVLFNRKQF